MPAGNMINFRLKDDDIKRLDQAAKQAGKSRSSFVRDAVSKAVTQYTGDTKPLEAASSRGSGVKKSGTPFLDCPRNTNCSLVRLPTGVKACQTCSLRW